MNRAYNKNHNAGATRTAHAADQVAEETKSAQSHPQRCRRAERPAVIESSPSQEESLQVLSAPDQGSTHTAPPSVKREVRRRPKRCYKAGRCRKPGCLFKHPLHWSPPALPSATGKSSTNTTRGFAVDEERAGSSAAGGIAPSSSSSPLREPDRRQNTKHCGQRKHCRNADCERRHPRGWLRPALSSAGHLSTHTTQHRTAVDEERARAEAAREEEDASEADRVFFSERSPRAAQYEAFDKGCEARREAQRKANVAFESAEVARRKFCDSRLFSLRLLGFARLTFYFSLLVFIRTALKSLPNAR